MRSTALSYKDESSEDDAWDEWSTPFHGVR